MRAASVLCLGAGGLGAPVAMYLAAAGIGRIGLVDDDAVDLSNLQRQLLHGTPDVGRPKVDSARDTLQRLNPGVEVVTHRARFNADNAFELLRPYDVVVDCTDNFPTRFLANDACVLLKKPNVYGSIFRFEGQASLFAPHLGAPCYRCLYPEPPPPGTVPSCAEGGVLGVLPGVIGCLQATEVIKLILGRGVTLMGRLLLFNALDLSFREIKLRRDPGCPVCGDQPTITTLMETKPACNLPPAPGPDEVTVHEMKRALENPQSGVTVVDVREPDELLLARVAGTVALPLSQLERRAGELDPEQPYYLHCKGGVRSMKALHWLRARGFKQLKSVQGGILAWSEQVDPKVPKY